MEPVHLLLISGSLQRASSNRALLKVAARCAEDLATVNWYERLGDVPHFNSDLPDDLESVVDWRAAVRAADGVLIASPEYAHSLPGSLKNALDWLV
jgi:NAD(P)H-dependent FMN reductase